MRVSAGRSPYPLRLFLSFFFILFVLFLFVFTRAVERNPGRLPFATGTGRRFYGTKTERGGRATNSQGRQSKRGRISVIVCWVAEDRVFVCRCLSQRIAPSFGTVFQLSLRPCLIDVEVPRVCPAW